MGKLPCTGLCAYSEVDARTIHKSEEMSVCNLVFEHDIIDYLHLRKIFYFSEEVLYILENSLIFHIFIKT